MRRSLRLSLAAAALALTLGCGGPTGFPAAAVVVTSGSAAAASTTGPVLELSEVGNALYDDVPAWFEVHNASSGTVELSDYTIRTAGLAPATGARVGQASFALPPLAVPPGAYAVIAGRTGPDQHEGGLLVHVSSDAGLAPTWYGSGHVELARGGVTIDFLRFGADTAAPLTPFTAATGPALPTAAGSDGAALVRGPGGRWILVPFATPGGPNDVAADARDSDGDGIPDAAKRPGGTYAGIDLYGMGARPGQRDMFVELDVVASDDPGVTPERAAIDGVVAAFARHGIALHVDAGDRFSRGFDPAAYDLGQRDATVPAVGCVALRAEVPGCAGDLLAIKAAAMALPRRAMFHYVLFAPSQRADGGAGSSGVADQPGTNVLITLGGWGLSAVDPTSAHLRANFQAATLMHELGHNLGLRHGGGDDVNGKPNYLSVMNYAYQLTGLPDPASPSAGDRYALDERQAGSYCGLEAGPCGDTASFRLDYSDGLGATLDEGAVDEAAGLGRGGAWVDFDGDGRLTPASYGLDLNGDGVRAVLTDHDDWGTLVLPFQRDAGWLREGAAPVDRTSLARARRPAALSFAEALRTPSEEPAPPAALIARLRSGDRP